MENSNSNSSPPSSSSSPFAVDLIKLDASLISQSNNNNDDGDDNGDDTHLLASKLNTNMKAEQILNACKSYGLNGLQSNCILQRLVSANAATLGNKKRKLSKKFKYKSEIDLIGGGGGVTEEDIDLDGDGEKLKKKVNILVSEL